MKPEVARLCQFSLTELFCCVPSKILSQIKRYHRPNLSSNTCQFQRYGIDLEALNNQLAEAI